jgi:hypothetical protein
MPNDLMNRWIAIAGFAVLAVVLFLEGAALSLTLQDRVGVDFRADPPRQMMRALFDRIALENGGTAATTSLLDRTAT